MGAVGKPFWLVWQLVFLSSCSSLLLFCSAAVTVNVNAPELTLQLQAGSSESIGRLEIEFYRTFSSASTYKLFGTICDHNFRLQEATVACRQLGYQYAEERTTPYFVSEGWGQIILQEVNCNGNEDKLIDCYYVINEEMSGCERSDDVGISCTNTKPQETSPDISPGDIRLVGGPNPYEGHVEVFMAETGEWATFCSSHWDFRKAELACEKLGYRPATSMETKRYGAGTGPIAICPATDNNLNTIDCRIISRLDRTCTHEMDKYIVCSGSEPGRQGEVRLVDGSTTTEGRVEFFDQNAWKTLCSDDWGIEEVQATCRQLGLPEPSSAAPPPGGTFGRGEAGAVLLNSITCTGQERTLQNCSWTPRTMTCTGGDASAQCGMRQAAEEFDLRLVDGNTITEGRVEMLYQGEWGSICGANVKDTEAVIICNLLGFQYAEGTQSFGRGNGEVLVSGLNCNGNEESILKCYHIFGNSGCYQSRKDLGVVCSNLPPSEEAHLAIGDLRLAGGPTLYEGRVEVYVSEAIGWATVCQENVDFSWAEQACQKLEYRPATSVGTMRYVAGDGPIVVCPEANRGLNIENCQLVNQTDPTVSCNHTRDIDVVCNGIEVDSSGGIRLQNGTEPTEGSVEIFYENVWHRVCADDWSIQEAKVVCYQLGMPVPNNTVSGGTFSGNANKEFVPQKFECSTFFGSYYERSLQDCTVTPRETPCSTGDAGVQCGIWDDAKEGDFRLSGGQVFSTGRLEVFHAGQWGTICLGSSITKEMTVACRQLGFLSNKDLYSLDISYNLPSLPIFLRMTECTGKEESVFECSDGFVDESPPCTDRSCCRFFFRVDCDPRPRAETFGVRLVNGPYPNQGIVQVLYDGLEGAICHWDWDDTEAEVVCRQLGYDSVVNKLLGWDVKHLYGYAYEEFKIQDLECDGSEGDLADCYFSVPGDNICSGYTGYQAGVVCYSDKYPSVNPRPEDEDTARATMTRNVVVGICIGVAALLSLCCLCYCKKKKSTPPVAAQTTVTQTLAGNCQVMDDPPPAYKDVTSTPDSYPVMSSGPPSYQNNKVGQTAV